MGKGVGWGARLPGIESQLWEIELVALLSEVQVAAL